MTKIAIIGAGAMGSGIARRLTDGGATIITDLTGRSQATRDRAEASGMQAATLDQVVRADIILSIVPPSEAATVARAIAAKARETDAAILFIDCNAIAPATMKEVAATFDGSRVACLDGSIIGAPPRGNTCPKLYLSGTETGRAQPLADHTLDIRPIDGGIGAASALKMSYAGITKGTTGLGTAMLLAAIRNGADESLRREMADSIPDLDQRLAKGIPDMFQKAYRWVAEMEEIADFLGEDDPASLIFRGMAGLYRRMAEDRDGDGELAAQLSALLRTATAKR